MLERIYIDFCTILFTGFLLVFCRGDSYHSSFNRSKKYLKIRNPFLSFLFISPWVTDVDQICKNDADKLSMIALVEYMIVIPLSIAAILLHFVFNLQSISLNVIALAACVSLVFAAIKKIDCLPAIEVYKRERTEKLKEQVLKELYDENEGE